MVGSLGLTRRARRRAWVGAAVAASALVAMSGSAAAEWLAPHDLSLPGGNAYGPRMVTGPDGVTHAFWDRDGSGVETADHVPGEGWSEPLRLSAVSDTGAGRPGLDVAGDLTLLWSESDGGQSTFRSAARPRGGEWTAPAFAAGPWEAGRLTSGDFAHGPDGTAIAMWTETAPGSPAAVRASVRPPGGGWSAPTVVSDPTRDAVSPMAVVDRQGNATMVWQQIFGNVNYASTRPAGGEWSPPERLSIHDWAGGASLAVADDGTVLAAWSARDGASRDTIEVGVRPRGGSWRVRNDVDGGPSFGSHAGPVSAAIGPDGEMTLTWTREIGAWARTQASTRPAGSDAWSAPETLSADGRNAFESRVGYASDGTVHAIWRRRNDVNYVMQAARRAPGGSWSQPANLSAASTNDLELNNPWLAFDGEGDPVVSWYRSDGAARRIQTTTDDTHGPRLRDVEVPERADPGQRVGFSVAELVDTWSGVEGTATWSFGDGATAAGTTAEHAFAVDGVYEVTVAATDTLGNRSEQTRTVTVGDPSRRDDPRREDPPVVDPPVVAPPVVLPPVVTPPAVDPPKPATPAAPRRRTRARAFAGCRVPRLAGLTLPQARRRLTAARCRLGRVRFVTTTRRGPARIVRASRRAGTRLRRGARVDVTHARRAPRTRDRGTR